MFSMAFVNIHFYSLYSYQNNHCGVFSKRKFDGLESGSFRLDFLQQYASSLAISSPK